MNKIFNLIGNGCTNPLYALMANGKHAVIKTHNNEMGNLALANEYICYKLSKSFGLPIPDAGIGYISKDTFLVIKDLINENNYGPCFYSERIDKSSKSNSNIVKHISNKKDFIRVLLFDHLVYNKDRNQGNLLVTASKKEVRFFIIDHTHVFKNETIWDETCLEQGIIGNDYNDLEILQYNKETYTPFLNNLDINENVLNDVVYEFKEIYKNINIDDIFNGIPSEWKPDSIALISLKKYLDYRVDKLEEISKNILQYIRR